MQKVLYNAKIYLEARHFVQALLIEDGVIIKTGNNEEVLLAADNAELIDCQAHTVIPGFNDSHLHLLNRGMLARQVQLSNCLSIRQIITQCRSFIAEHPAWVRQGLLGRGWNQDRFTEEKRIMTRHDLDQISTEIPIILRRVCGHVLVTNTKALAMLGLTGQSAQVAGGRFEIGADGLPNGIFAETACDLPLQLILKPDLKEQQELLLNAMEAAAAVGITSVQSNDIDDFEQQRDLITAIEELYHTEQAVVRYRFQSCFSSPASLARVLDHKQYRLSRPHPWLTLGPLKLFKDGSLGARTALLSQPYADDPLNHGIDALPDEEMDKYCALAAKHRLQVITHVIGDEAARRTMACYRRFNEHVNRNRNGLVHFQISDHELIKTAADDQLVIYYQPIFLEYDLHIVRDRVGLALAETSYAFRSVPEAGISVAYGTDCPVEDFNPFANLYCAVTRLDLQGQPAGGYQPSEKVTVEQALDAYTIGSAYAEFAENHKGRLKAGYVADLVVLDQDLFTVDSQLIKDIKPLLTMVGGEVVYNQKGGLL